MYKNIFWDFDGVLVDSNQIRTDGFKYIFRDFNIFHVKKLIKYHNNNGGLSRYKKINFFYEKIINQKITKHNLFTHLNEYTNYVYQKLIHKEILISENISFIKESQNLQHFIVSASDEKELLAVTKELEILPLFKDIKGSPKEKSINTLEIIKKFNLLNSECVLIGDSINDFESSKLSKIDFIGFNNIELKNKVPKYSNCIKSDLK